MAGESQEIDYLAGTKPYPKELSFADTIREAFALEHQCLQDQDIATQLGVTPGRLSQILNGPRALKAETVENVIRNLRSGVHCRAILKAWQHECFGEALAETDADRVVGDRIDQTTIKRIDRLIRTMKPDRALKVTSQALASEIDDNIRRKLLDRAFYLHNRLDQSGEAIAVARTVYEWGRATEDLGKIATGLVMKARILRSIDGVSASTIRAVHDEAMAIITLIPSAIAIAHKGAIPSNAMVEREHVANVLAYHEQHGGADDFLRASLNSVRTHLRATDSANVKGNTFQLEARIHLALKEYFKAEDILDEGFVSGDLTLGTDVNMALVKARIIAGRGDTEGAIDYYEKLCALCEQERNLYLLRVSQRDLAVLRSANFPAKWRP